MSATPSFEHVPAVGCEIGEAPIWVPEESRLHWWTPRGSVPWAARLAKPGSGDLSRLRTGIKGIVEPRFAG